MNTKGQRILLKSDIRAPNAASIVGQYIAELPSVKADVTGALPAQFAKKKTHKATEGKSKPRSYRFAKSVERKMKKAQRKLGVRNQTTLVEAAIIALCRKLGLD